MFGFGVAAVFAVLQDVKAKDDAGNQSDPVYVDY